MGERSRRLFRNNVLKRSYKKKRTRRLQSGGNTNELISGSAFKNKCKYNLDDRYSLVPYDTNILEGEQVFLKVGDINAFLKKPPNKKVILVIHNSDEIFDDTLMNSVKPYVKTVYAANCSAAGAIQIPLGFRDDQYTSHKVLSDVLNDVSKSGDKDTLCLVNFLIGTNGDERTKARDSFKGKSWVTISEKYTNYNPGKALNHSDPETQRLRVEFYSQLKRAKFVICPTGTGIDTHRVYESLYFGAIPIIKTSFLDPLYAKVGNCWIVKDWSEVTEEKCKRRWDTRGDIPFKMSINDWSIMNGGSKKLKIAFYSNHLGEQGTEIALYDYALFNQTLLKNESIIIYDKTSTRNNNKVIEKFKSKFNLYEISSILNIKEIDNILSEQKCDIIYMIVAGEKIDVPKNAKVCIHCVFQCMEQPFGDVYASITPYISGNNGKYPVVPHMINLPSHSRNMRSNLSIPDDAVVFGCYGGKDSFNIKYVQQIVCEVAKENKNIYFLFANINKFCDAQPTIIHLDTIYNLDKKVEFINTCDAMLWGRTEGETFGLAIGEFSSKNKPVFATKIGFNGYIEILKDKAVWYDEATLKGLIVGFNKDKYKDKDWNAYRDYTPEKVMETFKKVFIDGSLKQSGGRSRTPILYTKKLGKSYVSKGKTYKKYRGGNASTFSFITYGNDAYKSAKERILKEATDMGCFNGTIKAYGPEDLSQEFKDAVGDVLNQSRGGGYWIWKSHIIADALSKMNENDILLYADAGCSFKKEGLQRLMEYVKMISPESGYSVLAMRLGRDTTFYREKKWTTTAIFNEFKIPVDGEIANSNQILAGVQMYRKCNDSNKVVQKWLEMAKTRSDLFTDKYNEESKKTNPEFVDNRHDQSIFSIIVKIEPYNKYSKVIDEEIENIIPDYGLRPIIATRQQN